MGRVLICVLALLVLGSIDAKHFKRGVGKRLPGANGGGIAPPPPQGSGAGSPPGQGSGAGSPPAQGSGAGRPQEYGPVFVEEELLFEEEVALLGGAEEPAAAEEGGINQVVDAYAAQFENDELVEVVAVLAQVVFEHDQAVADLKQQLAEARAELANIQKLNLIQEGLNSELDSSINELTAELELYLAAEAEAEAEESGEPVTEAPEPEPVQIHSEIPKASGDGLSTGNVFSIKPPQEEKRETLAGPAVEKRGMETLNRVSQAKKRAQDLKRKGYND